MTSLWSVGALLSATLLANPVAVVALPQAPAPTNPVYANWGYPGPPPPVQPDGPAPIPALAGAAYGPPAQPVPFTFDPNYNNGGPRIGGPPETPVWSPDTPDVALHQDPVYGSRDFDLPFNKIFTGNLKFYDKLNKGAENFGSFDSYGPAWDGSNDSACGIPSNAYWESEVAIHPYFLKYANLDRYCMQDVCIAMWPLNGRDVDLMFKVTDICPTDPNDPTHCATPADLKVDRSKGAYLFGEDPAPQGPTGDMGGVGWWFTKCWADGNVQNAYNGNWFAQPPYHSSSSFSIGYSDAQARQNNLVYQSRGFPTYTPGHNHDTVMDPWTDWSPSDPIPTYTPIAGGAQRNVGPPAAKKARRSNSKCKNVPLSGMSSSTSTSTSVASSTAQASSASSSSSSSSSSTSSSSAAQASATGGGGSQQQSLYGQCGGIGWSGLTICASGLTCRIQNSYYSQCLY